MPPCGRCPPARSRQSHQAVREHRSYTAAMGPVYRFVLFLLPDISVSTPANLLKVSLSVSGISVSEKSFGFEKFGLGKYSWFRFQKIWSRKKSRFRKIWSRKRSWFRKIWFTKKFSVSVSAKSFGFVFGSFGIENKFQSLKIKLCPDNRV